MKSPYSHDGEREIRKRFGSRYQFDENDLNSIIQPFITQPMAAFIHRQPFFFIATADEKGYCDASFRGREYNASGEPLPVCAVVGKTELWFPDYKGNGFYNSLGNISVNPHIGVLFIDFEHRRRLRVNGSARILEADEDIRNLWPLAQAAVKVTVEQVYSNCPARIPKMRIVSENEDCI